MLDVLLLYLKRAHRVEMLAPPIVVHRRINIVNTIMIILNTIVIILNTSRSRRTAIRYTIRSVITLWCVLFRVCVHFEEMFWKFVVLLTIWYIII